MKPPRDRWEKARALFDGARALPVGQRIPFLEARCDDEVLRAEVEALLRAHEALEGNDQAGFLQLDPDRAAALLDPGRAGRPVSDSGGPAPGEILGRYRVERRLARGGMGVVYLAHDSRLDRPAALKLLPRHLSRDEMARRRFEDEARAASALDHPNIATVYEIGDGPDGRVFIAMAYYEGDTLQEEIDRGPLPVSRAVSLATQVADALAAAHRRGMVHRDVKPGNVLVTPEGVPKLLDFGIAKFSAEGLTRTGVRPGTVAYMSPEQTRGGPVDPRADVWALGATLYEMLAGRRPFPAERGDAAIFAIRHDEPEPIEQVRPDVPEETARVVARCLHKDPDRRYGDAAELFEALRGMGPGASVRRGVGSRRLRAQPLAGGALLALLLAGAALWATWSPREVATVEPASSLWPEQRLAVLPLVDESPDPEDAYFSGALTEELIANLSVLPGLQVIASASVAPFEDTERGMSEIGLELGVGTLLSGRLRKTDERVALSLVLLAVPGEDRLWSGDFDADVADLPALLREVGRHVRGALRVEAPGDPPGRSMTQAPGSPPAYVEYLKGRYFLGKHDVPSFALARDHFQRALDLDPTFARAWSGLAEAFVHLASVMGLSAGEAYPRAREAADRALALDPDLAEAHAALGVALAVYFWDSEAAERHFLRAIELDPSSAWAHGAYARHLRNRGRFDEALASAVRAQELDPLSAFPHIEEAIVHYVAGRHHEAIAKGQRLLAAAPDLVLAHNGLALNYAQLGRYDEALAALDRTDLHGENVNTLAIRGVVFARAGRHADARGVLARLEAIADGQPVSLFHHATIHASLGEHDLALDLLEEGARERASYLGLLKVEPIFAPLRSDPRFHDLLRRVGLQD
jgi:eukaryotic-like serine/threonine-protein kinase